MNETFSISESLTSATDLFNWVLDIITGNPLLSTAFVLSVLVPVGIMIFHKLKATV